ncbi:S8 family peptidase [Kitasatospora sp. NPDC086009]|uniref:S8 family peptidase n=1 Tax=unclassified Kitasatospora TaxID=2633591 RepID=UPI0037CBDEAD
MSPLVRRRTGRRVLAVAALTAVAVGVPAVLTAIPASTPEAAPPGWSAGIRSYLVISAPADVHSAKAAVVAKGGTVFASYDAIGVVVAHSTTGDFATTLRGVPGIQQVGATRTADVPADAYAPAVPAAPDESDEAPDETVGWNMSQIRADQAWDVTTGSRTVKVGVLDTGVDDLHQDLAPNFDAADSVSCAYGRTDTRAGSWRAIGSHGTHVAGIIAAARNGVGVVGVAPGVEIASVRTAEPGSLTYAENAVCGLVWAGDHGFRVTNSSNETDPWLFNCPDNPDQAAIIEGVRRAQEYAESRGSLQVAAAGNANQDFAGTPTDTSSPSDSEPFERTVTKACLDVPAELPGVVAVASTAVGGGWASYSNYGEGVIALAAPGGDGDADVYSTVPGGGYGMMSGTSMASPHVTGVAALIASTDPSLTPAGIRERLAAQADPQPCPASDTRCVGTEGDNGFFGKGEVDALKAVGGAVAATRRPVAVAGGSPE